MFHKENHTLDLLAQFTQNSSQSKNNQNDKENNVYSDLGLFMMNGNTKEKNSTLGIPNFLWYIVMLCLFIYLVKELSSLNQTNTTPDTLSTITKAVSDGTSKVTQEILDMQKSADKAFQNAKKEQK
ncbi:hypothetical protein [Sulfurospirillum sp.]|uniref:hypothetical protein n=1 Tax=Sulfurospirillum sp. TaxID=2053622 RepID=UPI002FDDA3C0